MNEKQSPMKAPEKLKLLFTVVDARKADYYTDLLQDQGINLQLTLLGHGTANRETLLYLGLAENNKAVLVGIIREDRVKTALDLLSEKFATVRNGKGVAWTVPLTGTIGVAVYRFLSDAR